MDLSLLHGNKYSKFPLLLIFFSCYDTIFVWWGTPIIYFPSLGHIFPTNGFLGYIWKGQKKKVLMHMLDKTRSISRSCIP